MSTFKTPSSLGLRPRRNIAPTGSHRGRHRARSRQRLLYARRGGRVLRACICGILRRVRTASVSAAEPMRSMLALRAFGIGPGDEVITVSHTAVATAAAVLACGATPVLVDVDPTYYTIDPSASSRRSPRGPRPIVPVHLYGQPADMDAIVPSPAPRAAYRRRLRAGHRRPERPQRLGSLGDIACFSFYPTKNFGRDRRRRHGRHARRRFAARVRRRAPIWLGRSAQDARERAGTRGLIRCRPPFWALSCRISMPTMRGARR